MKFTDVAHYYVHCMCLLKRHDSEHTYIGDFQSLMQAHNSSSIDWIKPIMMPLLKMKEEDAIKICQAADSIPFTFSKKKEWKLEGPDKRNFLTLRNANNDYYFVIDADDLSVAIYRDDEIAEAYPSMAPCVHEAIKLGYNIFNLPADQFIDKTTLEDYNAEKATSSTTA